MQRDPWSKKGESLIEPEFLLKAYEMGIFPMALENGEITWFSPDPRGVIPLEEFHMPTGLRRFLKKNPFEVRVDTAFRLVLKGCAAREETWIDEVILESFCHLHDEGHAHSVEAWRDNKLVGGLYGVSMAGAFFGESMFSLESNASKVALVVLVDRMRSRGMTLLDTQWTNDHLEQFGGREIPQADYLKQLEAAMALEVSFVD